MSKAARQDTCYERSSATTVISNFEAGEVQELVGGHLADNIDCPNFHLRKTHPEIHARDCTRIEVSLCACRGLDLLADTASRVVGDTLDRASTKEGMFVVQPPAKQWQNLAADRDRCLVLANRPKGEDIFVAWYATTGRISGVRVHPPPPAPHLNNAKDDDKWKQGCPQQETLDAEHIRSSE